MIQCICINRLEGNIHSTDCPYYLEYKARVDALSLLNIAFSKTITPRRFEGKMYVELDTLLDCLNHYKETLLTGIKKVPAEEHIN